jgi:hypothetical protein
MPQGLGAAAQFIGIAPSDQDNQKALGTIADPNAAAYQDTRARGVQQGYDALQNGGLNANFAGSQPGQMAQNSAMGLAGQLATGQGPSMARANMNMGLAQGTANINSMSQGGAAGGLGQRNAMNALASMQGNAAGQGAIAGAQEQIGNIQNYGALGSAARGQGIQEGTARTSAGLGVLAGSATLNQQQVQNSMAQDGLQIQQGNKRADVLTGQNRATAEGGNKLFDTGVKVASAAASGGATGVLGR